MIGLVTTIYARPEQIYPQFTHGGGGLECLLPIVLTLPRPGCRKSHSYSTTDWGFLSNFFSDYCEVVLVADFLSIRCGMLERRWNPKFLKEVFGLFGFSLSVTIFVFLQVCLLLCSVFSLPRLGY